MKKPRKRLEPADLMMTDGTKPLGRIVEKGDAWEVFAPDGGYLFKCPTLAEARQAIIQRSREEGR